MLKISKGPSSLMCDLRLMLIFIFFVDDLSLGISGMLKSPSIIFLLSLSRFMVVCICLTYSGAPVLDACVLLLQYLLPGLISLSLCSVLPCLL